jgi:hypothetical protein
MIKNYFYSIFLHSLIILLAIYSFTNKSINKNSDQELFIGFEHLISESTLSDLKTAKEQEIVQQKKIEKFIEQKKTISSTEVNTSEHQNIINPKKITNPDPQQNIDEKNIVKKEEKIIEEKNKNLSENQDDNNPKEVKNNGKTVENSGLSSREKLNILSQLKMCYHHAIQQSKNVSNLKFIVEVEISKDGYIQSKFESLIDKKRYLNPLNSEYKAMIDNVKKALELCSPLRNLPVEKYEMWKNLILNFENE